MGSREKSGRRSLIERLDVHLPLRLLGFGFIYAWGICLWDVPSLAAGTGTSLQAGPLWLPSALLTPLACVVGAFWGRRAGGGARPLTAAGAALCAGGTGALLAYGGGAEPTQAVLAVLAVVGTGCGPVLLVLAWADLFSHVEASVTETVVPASFVVTLLCALVIPTLPAALGAAALVALPLLAGLLLALSRASLESGHIPVEAATDTAPLSVKRGTVARMIIAIFMLYTLGCAAPAESLTLSPSAEAYTTVFGMLFAIALSVGIVLFSHRVNVASLYRWITVPFVIGIIATPIDSTIAALVARTFMGAVFTGAEIISIVYFIRLSQRTGLSAAFLVGLGAAAAYGGVVAGPLAMTQVHAAFPGLEPSFECLVLLGAFAATSLVVPRQDDTLEAVSPLAVNIADGSPTDAEPVTQSYSDELEGLVRHRSAIAEDHGLSPRETEIFLLLAQGRSRPYIRDSLYLSKNTVATHIRHIYEKLGVHSQQELIDLVEQ